MYKKFDYLIVGQGLAGSLLALELTKLGAKILIIHDETGPSSSKVAAGLYNPITGKRFVKTWLCDEIYPNLNEYYQNLEQQFGAKFLHQMPIKRPIENIREQNQFVGMCDTVENSQFIEYQQFSDQISTQFESKFGIISTKMSGWLDVPLFLNLVKKQFEKNSSILNQKFETTELILQKNSIQWKEFEFKKVLFCEGYEAVNNPYFNWLPFNAVKGEILTIEMESNLTNEVILKGIFILPIGKNKYKVGATYNWTDKTYQTTVEGKQYLLDKLSKLIKNDFVILSQNAGIRPSTTDRRPFLGLHPRYDTLGVFNGFGTKGVSLAPFFAKHFAENLVVQKQLMNDVNINRFYSLYLSFGEPISENIV